MPWEHSVPTQAEIVPIFELCALSLFQHAASKTQVVQLAVLHLCAVAVFGSELQSGHGTAPLCPDVSALGFVVQYRHSE